jgi:hypothetical protein
MMNYAPTPRKSNAISVTATLTAPMPMRFNSENSGFTVPTSMTVRMLATRRIKRTW